MSFIQNLSIFITRIHRDDAYENYIKSVFYEQEIAYVRRIDFIKKWDGCVVYYQAKIYFHYWFKNQIAYNLQQRILAPGNYGGRVVYADPWYWIVLKNNNPMTQMELCVNERLEEMEKKMYKRMKQMTHDIADLQTDVATLKEKEKMHKPNTHIRFCYFEEPVSSEPVNVDKIKQLSGVADDAAGAYEMISEDEAEQTAVACAETANACAETANACAENVLQERSSTPEWAEFCYGCSLLDAGTGGENQLEHTCQGYDYDHDYCEGCQLLSQGVGGFNQESHTCLESYE